MARSQCRATHASRLSRRSAHAVGALCIGVCLVASFIAAAAAPAAEPPDASARVDALFASVIGADAPGASVLVAHAGKVIHARGYGLANIEHSVPNQTDTVFLLGSLTKPLTATAILQLHDRGLLDLNDPVLKHLPDAPYPSEITIRHLLTHTSGLPSSADGPPEFAPGDRLNYSNHGYRLLGRIIEHASGDPYDAYLDKSVLQPLVMRSSGYDRPRAIVMNRSSGYVVDPAGTYLNAGEANLSEAGAAGALHSTVEDLYSWAQALFSGALLRPQTLRQALAPVVLNDGRTAAYGFGWMLGTYRGLAETGHGGDITGFNSWLSRFPDHDLTIIVLSNVELRPPGALPSARDLAHSIAEIYLSDSMEPENQRPPLALDSATLNRYVGRYRVTGAQEVVAVMGDILTISTDGSGLFGETKLGKLVLLPESETQFSCVPDNGGRLTFVVDDLGQAREIIIDVMGVRELRADRIHPQE